MLSIKVTDFFELLKKNKNGENSIEYFDIANTHTVNHHAEEEPLLLTS